MTEGAPIDRVRPVARGLAVGAALALVWAVLSVVLDAHIGLLAVAAFGGWLIGAAMRPAVEAPIDRGQRAAAAWVAALAWVAGAALVYLLSQAVLPAAVTPLSERLSIGGLIDYTIQTFDFVQAASIAILVVVAWFSAR